MANGHATSGCGVPAHCRLPASLVGPNDADREHRNVAAYSDSLSPMQWRDSESPTWESDARSTVHRVVGGQARNPVQDVMRRLRAIDCNSAF
jgi:hypothetical protein